MILLKKVKIVSFGDLHANRSTTLMTDRCHRSYDEMRVYGITRRRHCHVHMMKRDDTGL